jgi:hypothetical protein
LRDAASPAATALSGLGCVRLSIVTATLRRAGEQPPRRDQIAADRRVVGIRCAIAFVRNESSDADDPNDHSVANSIVSSAVSGRAKRSSAAALLAT